MAVKTGQLESRLGLIIAPRPEPNSCARPDAVPPDSVRPAEAAFETLGDPEFVAEAENANDLKPDPRDHSAQHDRRRPVDAAALNENLKPILAPKG